jgi:hypothetical protein
VKHCAPELFGCGAILAVILVSLAVLLSGCTTGGTPSICPPLKEYTVEENQRLLTELEVLPPGAYTIDVIADYMLLRDQVRACQ